MLFAKTINIVAGFSNSINICSVQVETLSPRVGVKTQIWEDMLLVTGKWVWHQPIFISVKVEKTTIYPNRRNITAIPRLSK